MKVFPILVLIVICCSCSDKPDVYSIKSFKSFKSLFTNGLFLSKLTQHNIPYQLDAYMGEEYVFVHVNFKKDVEKLRNESQTESRSLVLIQLKSECSQINLSQQLSALHVHHISINKAGMPSIRLTKKDNNSKTVTTILNEDDWRCH